MNPLQSLLAELIHFKSVTPEDAGCQNFMMNYLSAHGFVCQRFDNPPVKNFFARFGTGKPLLVFAGHTDVVPVGEESKWNTPPFDLKEIDGMVYGRGVADMKGSLAAMMSMAARFTNENPHCEGSLGFLITSGEEGDHYDQGTPYVMEQLKKEGTGIDYCVVGEPSATAKTGDVIKIGRRGSLTGKLLLHGKQGHVAYPHLADNPIHLISPVMAELSTTVWDNGNEHFPPTSFQITHVHSGGQAGNIIPGELTLQFNIRFSPEQTTEKLKKAVVQCFERHHLSPDIEWRLGGEPFLTDHGKLLGACQKAIRDITGRKATLSTSGGTSDGRFIAPYGVEVIELGPVNATIHQVNEGVLLSDLTLLSDIYYAICQDLLGSGNNSST